MQSIRDHNCVHAGAIAIALVSMIILAHGAAWAQPVYESYYLYLGNYPNNGTPGYRFNVQGLAHDADHWFISQQYLLSVPPGYVETGAIWRVPVEHDLDDVSSSDSGVTRKFLTDYPALADYNHVGDIVHYDRGNRAFLILPLQGNDVPAAVAVLDPGSSLVYLAHATIPQEGCGWVAVDRDGFLYSSESHPTSLLKYQVDWSRLQEFPPVLDLHLVATFPIRDENCTSLQIHHAQGGEFAPTGDLLYMSSGYWNDTDPVAEGIHVFDTHTWCRVQHSTNGYGHFNYEFEPTYGTAQEPEGLTIWDLDDGRAPGIRGQLHVLLLDHNPPFPDEIFIKHYTHVIRVDAANFGAEDGTPERPFRTVAGAAALAWNGAEIRTQAGSYPGGVTISNRVRLSAAGGVARIGD